jgi:transposase InsO family protein
METGAGFSDIARVLDAQPGSIFTVLRKHGGLKPAHRKRSSTHLATAEREEIRAGLSAKMSIRSIAQKLHRPPSTISREVNRTQEGWLYLATVIDLYSRRVVGWSMGSRMTAQLVCDALRMAIWQRRPKAGLIVHSDRGSQYASNAYRRLLKAHDFVGSMSRKGNCWDNAVAESFFGSLKQERVQWRNYQTRNEAQQDVMNYITMWYNSHRLHSYLGYKSPNQFEFEMQIPRLELKKAS